MCDGISLSAIETLLNDNEATSVGEAANPRQHFSHLVAPHEQMRQQEHQQQQHHSSHVADDDEEDNENMDYDESSYVDATREETSTPRPKTATSTNGTSSSTSSQVRPTTTASNSPTSILKNKEVVAAHRTHKSIQKTARYLLSLPQAPGQDQVNEQSLRNVITRLMKKVGELQKSGVRTIGRQVLEKFLDSEFKFPKIDPSKMRKEGGLGRLGPLDSEENLELAHATIDSEARQFHDGVDIGFQERETQGFKVCELLDLKAKERRKELKTLKNEVAKMKVKYDKVVEDLAKEKDLGSANFAIYREGQERLKHEEKRPKLEKETAEFTENIRSIREEKERINLLKDSIERENDGLRESLMELVDRRLECRVDERPTSKLKSKTKKMIAHLLRLGVPTEGVNVVIERILSGLNDFQIEGWPTLVDVDRINGVEDEDED